MAFVATLKSDKADIPKSLQSSPSEEVAVWERLKKEPQFLLFSCACASTIYMSERLICSLQHPKTNFQEKRFRNLLWQHLSTKDNATNAVQLLENSETHIESERSTAIEWIGTMWDVWDQAA